jgi:cytochrome P450
LRYYAPVLHGLIAPILRLFAAPRETPLADAFVLEAASAADPASFSLLARMREAGAQKPGLEQLDMAAESLDHMAAGIDTTGDGLCFLMWELSQPENRAVQRRLQDELRQNKSSKFDELPFLDAVVMEGLRCFPPIPMSLPRYVPSGGRTIEGYYLPAGTIVSSQAWSVHRIDETVFPEPEKFQPERWLQVGGEAERKRLFFAFSSGGRGCIGKQYVSKASFLLNRGSDPG